MDEADTVFLNEGRIAQIRRGCLFESGKDCFDQLPILVRFVCLHFVLHHDPFHVTLPC